MAAGLAAIPDNNGLLEQGVQLYLRMGQKDEALGLDPGRGSGRHPDDVFAINLQGNIYAVNKDYDSGRTELSPGAGTAAPICRKQRCIWRASWSWPAKETRRSVRRKSLLTATRASSPSQYILLAELYAKSGQHEKSLAVYDRALARYPENWFIMNSLAYSLADVQNPSVEELSQSGGACPKGSGACTGQ